MLTIYNQNKDILNLAFLKIYGSENIENLKSFIKESIDKEYKSSDYSFTDSIFFKKENGVKRINIEMLRKGNYNENFRRLILKHQKEIEEAYNKLEGIDFNIENPTILVKHQHIYTLKEIKNNDFEIFGKYSLNKIKYDLIILGRYKIAGMIVENPIVVQDEEQGYDEINLEICNFKEIEIV